MAIAKTFKYKFVLESKYFSNFNAPYCITYRHLRKYDMTSGCRDLANLITKIFMQFDFCCAVKGLNAKNNKSLIKT